MGRALRAWWTSLRPTTRYLAGIWTISYAVWLVLALLGLGDEGRAACIGLMAGSLFVACVRLEARVNELEQELRDR